MALSGSGGRSELRINGGDDTVMVDGGVEDSDDSGLRSIDLATLGGVLRVCDVELLLLDGNGPRAAFASRVHEEALFCSISCGSTAVAASCCHPTGRCWGICTPPMNTELVPRGAACTGDGADGDARRHQRVYAQPWYAHDPDAGAGRTGATQVDRTQPAQHTARGPGTSLFNLANDSAPLAHHYQQLHLQLGQGAGLQPQEPNDCCTSTCRPCSAQAPPIGPVAAAHGARII